LRVRHRMARAREAGRPVRDSMYDHSTNRTNLVRWPPLALSRGKTEYTGDVLEFSPRGSSKRTEDGFGPKAPRVRRRRFPLRFRCWRKPLRPPP